MHWALDTVRSMSPEIQSKIEIIDLRSLVPWDEELVLDSIVKTGKALIIHEASQTAGFGAEVSATISEKAFEYLDAPVTRIGSIDTPTPFSPSIEKKVYWEKDGIAEKIMNLLNY